MKTQLAHLGIRVGQTVSRTTTAHASSLSGLNGDPFPVPRPSGSPVHHQLAINLDEQRVRNTNDASMPNRPESNYKILPIRHKQCSSARIHPYKQNFQTAGPDGTHLMPPPPRRQPQNHIPIGNDKHILNGKPPVTPVDKSLRQPLDAFYYPSQSFSQQSVQPVSMSHQHGADMNPMSEHNFQMSGALPHQNQHDQPAYSLCQSPDTRMPTRQGCSMQPVQSETSPSRLPPSRHLQEEFLVHKDRRGPSKPKQSPVFMRHAYVEDEPFQLVKSSHGRHTCSNTLNSLSFIKDPYTTLDTKSGCNHLGYLQVQHSSVQRPITQQYYDTSSQVSRLTPYRPAHRIENRSSPSLQSLHHGATLPPRSIARLDHVRSTATYQFPGPAVKMTPHERKGASSKGPLRVGARSSREVHSSMGLRRRIVR
jgi:hypothetical protein